MTGISQSGFFPKQYYLSAITTDGISPTPLLINGDDLLAVPDETVWKVSGEGEVLDNSGNIAYFKFEALIKNLSAGTDQYINFAKVITGGSAPSASVSGSTNYSGTSTSNNEALAIGGGYPNGDVHVTCKVGFGFSTAKFGLTAVAGNLLFPYAIGQAATTLHWKAKIYIVELDNS